VQVLPKLIAFPSNFLRREESYQPEPLISLPRSGINAIDFFQNDKKYCKFWRLHASEAQPV